MMKKLILVSALFAQMFAIESHAALFDDTEARKKILDVEATMNSQNQATQTEISNLKKSQQAIEPRLNSIEAVTKGQGLIELQNQLEALKAEIAKLKGDLEVANHTIEATQQRQKDLYSDTDARIRKLEGGTARNAIVPSVPTATVSADGAAIDTTTSASGVPATTSTPAADKNSTEYQLLEIANGLVKEYKYKEAFNAYDKFIKDYPNSAYAAEATYGLGYSQFALKNYKSSLATQQKVVDLYPGSPKVPDAMLNMASNQIQLGLVPWAKKTLRELIARYPNSEVIPTAQKRLKSLEAIK